MTGEELKSIWIPQLIMKNTRTLEKTETSDNDVIVTVQRNGSFIMSTSDVVHEIMIFEGRDNWLLYERAFQKIFQCAFDMRMYILIPKPVSWTLF